VAAPKTAAELYAQLLEMYRTAFGERRFEISHHLLAAALHAAEEASDLTGLAQVEKLAAESQSAIDRNQSSVAMSSESSGSRGNVARFTALAATARAVRGRLALTSGHHEPSGPVEP
jgi:hypothetical protein